MRIRPYVQGQDDEVLLAIVNGSWAESPDFVSTTLEQLRVEQRSPDWTAAGRYIAELDGDPVGMAKGRVDRHRKEPVGFLAGPAVLPGFRRQGIGTALAEQTMDYLRSQGRERAQTGVGSWNKAGTAFLEKLGFQPVRRFSEMRRPLAGLPSNIGESRDVAIRPVGASDEDVDLLVRLSNEAFCEHFGHRDATVEEWGFWAQNHESMGYVVHWTVARLGGKPVGYLICGHSPRENRELDTKRGGLWSVGVLKEHRNQGIAKALMLEGMRWLAAQGLDEVDLRVDDDNVTRARNLYERLGFKLLRSDVTYERPLGPSPPTESGGESGAVTNL